MVIHDQGGVFTLYPLLPNSMMVIKQIQCVPMGHTRQLKNGDGKVSDHKIRPQ